MPTMKTMNKKIRCCCIGTDWSTNDERRVNNRYGGVTYYRLIKPLVENINDKFEFEYHGSDIQKESQNKTPVEFWENFVSRFDVFIVKHIDNEEACSNLLFMVRHQGKKIILDLDDNLFEIKKDQPAYEIYGPGKPKRAVVTALISMVDALWVSTQPLADYYKKIIREMFNIELNVYVLPNYNDLNDFNFPKTKKDDKKIIIGWAGSTTHFNDLRVAIPAIKKLLKEFPTLQFELVGGVSHEKAPELFYDIDEKLLERIFCGSGTEAWKGYPEMLSKLKWDIGIAPLTDDEFNRGKSHIKWIEYAAYKIPTVASKVYPYYAPILGQNTIVDGKTGFLCEDNEWYLKLKRLILDKKLREEIGQNAYNDVKENLQYKNHYYLWIDALSQVEKT